LEIKIPYNDIINDTMSINQLNVYLGGKTMLSFFKNKLVWIGLGIIALISSVFTFAFIGSTINPTAKELPLGIVVLDEGVKLPNGERLNLGELLEYEVKKRDTSSVKWSFFNSKEEALKAMDEREVYAIILVPENLSSNIFSLLTESPGEPTTTIILNEGMNQVGVNVATQISNGILSNFNQQIQTRLLSQLEEMNWPLSVDLTKVVISPVKIKMEKINSVPPNHANGNTPALITQLIWISTFISSMILFTLIKRLTDGKWTLKSIGTQIFAGILYVTLISGVIHLLTVRVLNMDVSSQDQLFMSLLFIGMSFFLLQNSLLNWIGYPAAPIFILLLFFSMPILTMAPEMLPEMTRDYLYSWTPFRYSLDRLRDILFFDMKLFEDGVGTLGMIGIISFFLMVLSILKPNALKKSNETKYEAAVKNEQS